MDDEDYREIIKYLTSKLEEIGATEIAAPILYLQRDSESGETKQLPSQEHLIEMLRAIERHFAILDRHPFEIALQTINETLEKGEKLNDAVLETRDEYGEPSYVSLSSAPQLKEIRGQLNNLINSFLDPNPAPGMR